MDGWNSVELCQAYILTGLYAIPARRWEEDPSWLYAGLDIRYVLLILDDVSLFLYSVVTDLKLHRQRNRHGSELAELQDREE